jgi:hypothetical protein
MAEGDWPKKIGRGWNTSDGYRFFNQDKAEFHQQRVDERESQTEAEESD